jgi:predicted PurR-regulated permease PerM
MDSYLYIQKIDLPSNIGKVVSLFLSDETARVVAVQVNLFVSKFFSFSLTSVSGIFSDLPRILFQIFVTILTFFFVTRDGDKIRKYLSELSPLSTSTEDKFADAFRGVTNSIVFGQLLTGLIQGLALGLGLWILGVPKVFFLTVIAIFLSIIPMIGAWLVWVPVSLFLLVSGQTVNGTILFFYGLLFVSTLDNFLRPYFISRKTNLNLFIAIIGTIGGLYSFGFIGLILGPLILSYFLIVIEFYKEGKLNELFRQ